MGVNQSTKKPDYDVDGQVNFDHFQILRAIGKGSFGKVCIVQKRDTKKMYAMKYMNKSLIIKKEAVHNVIREVEMLKSLEHPFIVNLWFTFQDEEDMFMVVDLLLGGDLRYHLQENVKFTEDILLLYVAEIALALDYLHQQHVMHRDIKPDNVLLDEEGHVHLTDFNIATELQPGHKAISLSGTKPYMAPELFACSTEDCIGYSFAVDWWSLGIMIFEMLRGRRPFDIHTGTTINEVLQLLRQPVLYPSCWSNQFTDLLQKLLTLNPNNRLKSLVQLKSHPSMANMDFDDVLKMKTKPGFIPAKDHLNCDPTFELEEMIIEAKPLHKKKKRLAKKNSRSEKTECDVNDPLQIALNNINNDFKPYDRAREGNVPKENEKHERQPLSGRISAESETDVNEENKAVDSGEHTPTQKVENQESENQILSASQATEENSSRTVVTTASH